jgi:ATP-binding cassette subfamily C protein|tara:strand:+ start:1595 stop:3394 length:1800 start_codon:yes stop_codon:yes gene_type:complete
VIQQLKDCLYLLDRRARTQFAALGLMMIFAALLESLSVGLVLPFLHLIEDPARLANVPVFGDLLDAFGDVSRGRLFAYAAVGLLAVVLVKNLFLVILVYFQYRIAYQNLWALSKRLYRLYLESPFVNTQHRNSAELIRNVHEAVNETTNSVILGFVTVFTEISVVIAIAVLLLLLQPEATLAAGAILVVAVVGYHLAARQKFTAWGARALSLQRDVFQALQQGLHSLKTTKVHGREDYFLEAYSRARRELSFLGALINTANNVPRLWVEMVVIAGVLIVLVFLIAGGTGEAEMLPVLGLFSVAAFRMMPSANRMIVAFNNIKHGKAALDSVVTDIRSQAPRRSAAPEAESALGAESLRSLQLEAVSFTYPGEQTSAIDNVSLQITPGVSLGVVGPSGAGKTTLVDILLGLLAPTKGRVLVNGRGLSGMRQAWRHRLGYVPQSIYILDDTLRRNIAFGYADDEIDEDAVLTAIKRAQLEDFVDGLAEGLDTVLGEHGARLSGGQQQRIGIARALYHDPEVLVLDEATSSLDTETEQEITAAIDNLRGIKTLVIIAHRLSTVRQCDRLIYLENGKLADSGTFEELAAGNDTFRNLVELSRL